MKEIIKKIEEKYEIISKVWEGTFGATWKAKTKKNDLVIVQLINDYYLIEKLKNEEPHMNKIWEVMHPSLAQFLELYIEDKFAYIIWEYIKGRRLFTYIKELKKIKINIALYITRKILEILSFTASNGVVHGGIRATRIIVTPDKDINITNFGIGVLEQKVIAQRYKEKDKKYEKIYPYFPQEVLEDDIFEDPKSDIYAVGILLTEMLTGKRLYGKQVIEELEKNKISPNLQFIIKKAIADFEERYNHPQEMYYELNKVLLKESDKVEKIYVPPPQPKDKKGISLEAIPADSEEYKIYQAEVIAAKQVIDAEVVTAEPAEGEELGESVLQSLKTSRLKKSKVSKLKSTIRVDPTLLLVSTIDKKILDPLENDPIWPSIFLKFTLTSISLLSIIFFLVYTFSSQNIELYKIKWLSAPFYFILKSEQSIKFIISSLLIIFYGTILFLPLIDNKGKLRYNLLFFFVILFFLSLMLTICFINV